MGYLQQCGQKGGKRVDVCLCATIRSGVVYRSEDSLEEEGASVGKSDTDECQEEIPKHIARISSPEFPNNGVLTKVFEQRSERTGGECRTQLPDVILVQGVVSALPDEGNDPVEGDPIPEGTIIFGRDALADVIFANSSARDGERHVQHDDKRGDDYGQVDNTCRQCGLGWQWELVDAVVEEQSTQSDEVCHGICKIESEEVVEDGFGWPYDRSEGGVEPGHSGDDGYNSVLNRGVNGGQIRPKPQPREDLEHRQGGEGSCAENGVGFGSDVIRRVTLCFLV